MACATCGGRTSTRTTAKLVTRQPSLPLATSGAAKIPQVMNAQTIFLAELRRPTAFAITCVKPEIYRLDALTML